MIHESASSQRDALVSEVASSSGVKEEDVSRVLDYLGLSKTLDRVAESLGPEAVESVSVDGMGVTLRAAGVLVAV